MARTEKELPINNISYQFVGTEEDLIKFLKAITFEYLTANYPDTEDVPFPEKWTKKVMKITNE